MWPGAGERIKRTRTDILFSEYVRHRDDWTCQRCGKKFTQGVDSRGLHCAHVWFGRANKTTRWEPINCVSLCIGCHNQVDQSPAEAWELLISKITPQEILWLQQQKDEKRTIKISKEVEMEARERVKQLLLDIKKE
jgi:5-methylcytosine-specific restriction endonuclease McrA